MHKLSRAGIVLGDLKLDNMLVDAHGETGITAETSKPANARRSRTVLRYSLSMYADASIPKHIPFFALSTYSPCPPIAYFLTRAPPGHVTLSDVDGAGLLEEGLLRTTQLVAAQAAAQAAAMCLDPVAAEAAVWRAADLMFTQEQPTMITDAFAPFEMRALHLMCGASHQHLVGASLGALLAAIQPLLLAAGRTACFYFVTELNGLAMGLQTLAHTNRPDLQSVWSQLEAIGARWV